LAGRHAHHQCHHHDGIDEEWFEKASKVESDRFRNSPELESLLRIDSFAPFLGIRPDIRS